MNLNVKLVLGAAIMAATVGYVAYLGASSSWQYYVLVDECADAKHLTNRRVRVSGRVALASLTIAADRSEAAFFLEGNRHRLAVRCPGPLPDNLAEGMDVVVEGALLTDGRLQGDTVITRCASKYAPEGA